MLTKISSVSQGLLLNADSMWDTYSSSMWDHNKTILVPAIWYYTFLLIGRLSMNYQVSHPKLADGMANSVD